MNYIGVDYHKHYSHITVVDEGGSVVRSGRVLNEEKELEEFLGGLEGPSHIPSGNPDVNTVNSMSTDQPR